MFIRFLLRFLIGPKQEPDSEVIHRTPLAKHYVRDVTIVLRRVALEFIKHAPYNVSVTTPFWALRFYRSKDFRERVFSRARVVNKRNRRFSFPLGISVNA